MGISYYFYEYKTKEEKDKIIASIEAYRQAFYKLHAINLEAAKIDKFFDKHYGPTLDEIKNGIPGLRMDNVDYEDNTLTIRLNIEANCYINVYNDVIEKDGRRGINVLLWFSASTTFDRHMRTNGFHSNSIFTGIEPEVIEKFEADKFDFYGNEIDPDLQYIDLECGFIIE